MSNHGTNHAPLFTEALTNRSRQSRRGLIRAQATNHATNHGNHAPSNHDSPPLFRGGRSDAHRDSAVTTTVGAVTQ